MREFKDVLGRLYKPGDILVYTRQKELLFFVVESTDGENVQVAYPNKSYSGEWKLKQTYFQNPGRGLILPDSHFADTLEYNGSRDYKGLSILQDGIRNGLRKKDLIKYFEKESIAINFMEL